MEIYVDGFDGATEDAGGLPVVDALGLLAFAQHHTWDRVHEDDEA